MPLSDLESTVKSSKVFPLELFSAYVYNMELKMQKGWMPMEIPYRTVYCIQTTTKLAQQQQG